MKKFYFSIWILASILLGNFAFAQQISSIDTKKEKLPDEWINPEGNFIVNNAQQPNEYPKNQKTIEFEGWETGDMSHLPWVTSGDADFFVTNEAPYEGGYCIKSGNIWHNEYSGLSITMYISSAGYISFYRKISSESGYDYLRFYIDGSEQANWSGYYGWNNYSFSVNQGVHTFEWRYTKDGSVSNGSDCAWIDNITFPPTLDSPLNLNASLDFATATTSLTWEYDASKTFQNFNVYRDDVLIGTTTDTVYSDVLSSYGEYDYKVAAQHSEGESGFSNIETVFYSPLEVDKKNMDYGLVIIGNGSTQQFTINNLGSSVMNGIITTPADFSAGETKSTINFTIPASSGKTYNLTFTPTLDQNYQGEVLISDGTFTKSIAVSGEGTTLVTLPYLESFETDLGEWEQSTDDDFDWTRKSGSTPTSYTGPYSAYDGNYYLYTEASNAYPNKEFGLKESFDFSAIAKPYLSFWYHMYGSSMGQLKVQLSLDGSSWVDIWTQSGNQGDSWQQANIDLGVFAGQNMVNIKFLGITGNDETSDMAIDYINVFNNLDKPTNLVADLNPMTSIVSLIWNFNTSKAFQYFNVYRNDVLIGTTTDTIYSDTLTAFGNFDYKVSAMHDEGESPFSNVESITHSSITPTNLTGSLENTTSEVVLNWDFNTSKAFQNFNIYRNDVLVGTSTTTTYTETLSSFGTYTYKVSALWEEGESGFSNTITLVHSAIVPSGLTAVLDTTTATVDLSWIFDNSKAFQNFNIYRNNVIVGTSTDTSYTDVLPGYGEYVYKVTSLYDEGESGSSGTETIVYTSINVSPDSLDFGIVAVGKSLTQQIIIQNTGSSMLIGGITTPAGFSAGNSKNTLTYLIPAMSADTFDIVFSPTAQQVYSGNIVITHNAAGPDKIIPVSGEGRIVQTLPYSESFETDFGIWEFSDDDDYDWTRHSGPTPSSSTGPPAAYDGSYYIYTEATGNNNKDFGLEGAFSFENIAYPAISFWYNMYGYNMGTLKVQISTDAGNNWTDIWTLSGDQGNLWHQTQIDLSSYTGEDLVMIRFWGHTGNNYKSDMAIDLVELYNNLDAPENLDASFEPTTGQVYLVWEYSGAKAFQHFIVYKNDVAITTTTDTTFTEVISSFGTYEYKVTALYDEGESNPSNTETVIFEATAPTNLTANLDESNGNVTLNWEMGNSSAGYGYAVYEDFEDGVANNWEINDNRFSIANGKLIMNGYSNDTWASAYYDEVFDNYTLEYEFGRQQSSGTIGKSIGTIIHSNGYFEGSGANGYEINFTTSGYYSVWKMVNGSESSIINWTSSSYINTGFGVSNVVSIHVNGANFEIYVNGHFVNSFTDNTFSSGIIALGTYDSSSGTNEVWFDNVTVLPNNGKLANIKNKNPVNEGNALTFGDPRYTDFEPLQNSYTFPQGILGAPNKASKAFQEYKIYRDDVVIGTTTDTTYTDTLSAYGEYKYKVTALYDEGESNPSNEETIAYSSIAVDVDSLDFGIVAIGTTKVLPITISNSGSTAITGTISTPNGYTVNSTKNTLNYTVAPNSSASFDISFAPASEQTYTGNIVITHNAFGDDKTVIVSGTGAYIFSLPYSESFETDFGGWKFSDDDDYNWTRYSGSTPSSSTGPSSAYDGSYYLYTEASGYNNKDFGLEGTFDFNNVSKPVMTFWYNMYGYDMGTLKVQISLDGSNWTDVWTLSGDQGTSWHQAQIDLTSYAGEEAVIVRFWGHTGSDYQSDMAIDLVELYSDLDAPYNLVATLNASTGEVSLDWDFDGGKSFQNFNIYREDVLVGTSVNSDYAETLPTYGVYDYYVKALHTDGESDASNTETVNWEYTNFSVSPGTLTADLAAGDSTVQVMTISDLGGVGLDYTISIEYSSKAVGAKLSVKEAIQSVINNSGILDGPITKTSYSIVDKKEITTVSTKPEDVAFTVYADSKSNLNVAVLGAEGSPSYLVDVQNKLSATGKFSSVSYINVQITTPTLTELQAFDAILVWSNYHYSNSSLLGNNMADYVDGGGGVVPMMFDLRGEYAMSGRWLNEGYYVLPKSANNYSSSVLGSVFAPDHPIMSGISSVSGHHQPSTTTIPADANLIASWSNGKPMVVVDNTLPVVELGFWPVSSDVSSYGWGASTDGALLMANALEFVANGGGGWLSVNPESGSIAGNGTADIDVKFNATGLAPGTYHANIIISNSGKAQIQVPVTLNVLHPISIDAKAFLEGPFFGSQMNNLLKLYDYLPLSQPYNTAPWNYAGTESVAAIPNNDVVDWVLVEVRETSGDASTATGGTVIGRRAGFILKDGSIVDTDGSSPLTFSTVASQNIFAVIYHRNHIPIMSANQLSTTGNVYTIDFTTSETQVYGGTSACKELSSGVWGMLSGNALQDKQIDNKDKNDVWEVEKGNAGYYNGDMNMNGQVDAADEQVNWEGNAGNSSNVPE